MYEYILYIKSWNQVEKKSWSMPTYRFVVWHEGTSKEKKRNNQRRRRNNRKESNHTSQEKKASQEEKCSYHMKCCCAIKWDESRSLTIRLGNIEIKGERAGQSPVSAGGKVKLGTGCRRQLKNVCCVRAEKMGAVAGVGCVVRRSRRWFVCRWGWFRTERDTRDAGGSEGIVITSLRRRGMDSQAQGEGLSASDRSRDTPPVAGNRTKAESMNTAAGSLRGELMAKMKMVLFDCSYFLSQVWGAVILWEGGLGEVV